MKYFAFDIGGTTMRMAELSDNGTGPIARMPTPKDPTEAIEALARLALAHAKEHGIKEVIVALAAVVSPDGSVLTSTNLPAWDGFPFGERLSQMLSCPVTVVNDAELAALGEARYGAAREASNVAYLTIGTGVGTAHVVDGVVENLSSEGEARDAIIMLPRGKSLETEIGGKALEMKYGMLPADLPRSTWKELTILLARGISQAIALWHPEVVVLGGSLVNEEDGFRLEDIVRDVQQGAKDADALPPIRVAELGDASALHGARALIEKALVMP